MKHADLISQLSNQQKAELLTGKDFWSTVELKNPRIPSAYLSDGPHGIRKQAAASDHLGLNASIPATCFPTAASMANSWNEELGQQMGTALGEEAAAQKVNVLLGPGTNIKRNPLCGRNFEYFSEDPYLAGKMAASYIRGIQSKGISACIKHFALNNQEQRRMVIDSIVDERTMRELYLTAFELAVKEGKTQTLMSSYNKVNGAYANENMHLMQDILRKDWGYEGVVVTDWGGCNDRVQGVLAGNELEMPACQYGAADVLKALEAGTLSQQTVDQCLDRLLDLILRTDTAIQKSPSSFDVEAHHALARKCAEECIVLLKNEHDILPLGGEKICFIGDFARESRYQGAGSSIVNPTKVESILEEVRSSSLNYVGFAQGFERYGKKNARLKEEAMQLAASSDTIVFFAGLDELSEAEGIDRPNMKLPAVQLELFSSLCSLGKKMVVILFCGSPVELDVLEQADGILHAYLGGQAVASALLNILTGKVNPSGKLAESYPFRYDDVPSVNYWHANDFVAEYREGFFVGYRYYATAHVPVRFPFGYGLSYTRFDYSDLKADEKGVSFTITNTGTQAGAEIAQLYISKPESCVPRPCMELKGFRKVFLNPGESAAVRIDFNDYSFRVYNPQAGAWQIEGGEYQLLIGASSADIRLKTNLEIAGNETDFGYDQDHLVRYFEADVQKLSKEEFERLLGHKVQIPSYTYTGSDQKHILVGENSTVSDLRHAKGCSGRLFSWGIRTAHSFLEKTGNKSAANTLEMGMVHLPVRAIAKFGGMNRNQLEGMMTVFNGHLINGLKLFLKK